jgi:hypothetical protein
VFAQIMTDKAAIDASVKWQGGVLRITRPAFSVVVSPKRLDYQGSEFPERCRKRCRRLSLV